MDLTRHAKRLERRLTRSVGAAIGELVGRAAPEPIEIVHAVLDRAEQQVQEVGRGQRIFPFTRVIVHALVPPRDREARARLLAVASGPPSFEERLRKRLTSAGCSPRPVSVDIVFEARRAAHWCAPAFHVRYEREAEAPAAGTLEAAPGGPPKLKLAVTTGAAERPAYLFAAGRVDIGRRSEVLDARQQLVRTNHIAFTEDGDAVNRSVSRRHAHIVWTGSEYRLCDDRSAHGTRIVRDGRTIPVPPGARGVRLLAGDDVLLGQARLRVAAITPPPLRRP